MTQGALSTVHVPPSHFIPTKPHLIPILWNEKKGPGRSSYLLKVTHLRSGEAQLSPSETRPGAPEGVPLLSHSQRPPPSTEELLGFNGPHKLVG